jgi:glutathione S-transferase
MYELYIANKNYSSWSLRPWVLMRELKIQFAEHLVRFGEVSSWETFSKISPSGNAPCLVDGQIVVWDSLAIVEYLAERHPAVWPADFIARAWARSAAAEMHSGFSELRNRCTMSCGQRVRLKQMPVVLEREIARLGALWNDGLLRFGGPYLAGKAFTAVDAFFAPVAFRIQTYALALDPVSSAYAYRLLALPSLRDWYSEALQEKFRDEPHEQVIRRTSTVLEDLREK